MIPQPYSFLQRETLWLGPTEATIKYLTSIPQDCQGCGKRGKTEKWSQTRGERGDRIQINVLWYPGLDTRTKKSTQMMKSE